MKYTELKLPMVPSCPDRAPPPPSAVAIVLFFVAVLASVANASHVITLRNNCAFGVGMTLSKFPHDGVDYTGPAIPDIAAFSSTSITVPTGCIWRGALLDDRVDLRLTQHRRANVRDTLLVIHVPKSDTSLGSDYDISNIQGFSVVRIRFLAFTFAQVDVSSRNKFSHPVGALSLHVRVRAALVAR
ncbi:hypothetical protein B0H10DRAFT_1945751 [Mycena sp. CBHHK59/15]|nr:hypothetical protein B0H10DRAFT_1945751 [Mycena sp. CBHHK59/15]